MSEMRSPDLSSQSLAVIIVNYHAAHLVVAHLDALLGELTPFASARVIIVDNQSPGDDAEVLEKAAEPFDSVEVIRAPKNGGFAYGNNRGLEVATDEDLVFFLNPDAYPKPGALTRLAETLLTEERAGVVGPRLINNHGEERASAFSPFTPGIVYKQAGGLAGRLIGGPQELVMQLEEDGVIEAAWIPGAAMLVSREALNAVGGLDEGYFLYFEETDWLETIGRAGFRVLVDARATVEHIEGQSTGVVGSSGSRSDLPGYWYESWRRFWLKNRSRPTAILAAIAFLAGLFTGGVGRILKGKKETGRGPRIATFFKTCFLPILTGSKP